MYLHAAADRGARRGALVRRSARARRGARARSGACFEAEDSRICDHSLLVCRPDMNRRTERPRAYLQATCGLIRGGSGGARAAGGRGEAARARLEGEGRRRARGWRARGGGARAEGGRGEAARARKEGEAGGLPGVS